MCLHGAGYRVTDNGGVRVSVIVATLGLPERALLLRAAVDSIVQQDGVVGVPIVVLNGTRCAPDVERWLENDPRIRLIRQATASLPGALSAGAAAAETLYFGALDDDDMLLPGALETRVRVLEEEGTDVVVTNGYRETGTSRVLNVPADTAVADAPLRTLMTRNWLLPGSWLCRSDRIPDPFDGMPKYLECTFLAVRFALEHPMSWVAEPTVVYRLGSPAAESLSREYVLGQVPALKRIRALGLPPEIRRAVERKVASACHSASELERRSGNLGGAWRWHLKSLVGRGGWVYLPYTRHLLFGRRSG